MRVLWFVLLLPLAALAAPTSQNSCMSKNSFLAAMSTAKPLSVTVMESPRFVKTNHCGDEWKKYGTCCDEHDLTDFLELERRLIINNQDYLKRMANTLKNQLMYLDQRYTTLKNTASGLLSSIGDVSSICWSTMTKIRSSAMCAICSGRSQRFFAHGKILVSKDTCKKVVFECRTFFMILSRIVQILPQLKKAFEHKSTKKNTNEDNAILIMQDLQTYSPSTVIIDAFTEAEDNYFDFKNQGLYQAKVCSLILNVRKKPYIMVADQKGLEAVKNKSTRQINRKEKEELKAFRDTQYKANKDAQKAQQEAIREEGYRHSQILKKIKSKKLLSSKQLHKLKKEENQRHKEKLTEIKNEYQEKLKAFKETNAKLRKATQYKYDNTRSKISNDLKEQRRNWQDKESKKKSTKSRFLFTKKYIDREIPMSNSELALLSTRSLESDSLVLIKPSDNMFSAFEGAQGTQLAAENSPLRAMNTSLAFP